MKVSSLLIKIHNNSNIILISIKIVRSVSLLAQNNIIVLGDCINMLQDSDGAEYFVPNFCINDPFLEKDLTIKEVPENEKIEVNYYYTKHTKDIY